MVSQDAPLIAALVVPFQRLFHHPIQF